MIKYKLKQFWLRFCIRSLFFACFSVNLRVKKFSWDAKTKRIIRFRAFFKTQALYFTLFTVSFGYEFGYNLIHKI
jgi:hypothetical protein